MTNVVTVTQARDNLSEILGKVKFGEEIITIEKKGKPYAVIMSPEEYKRYKEVAKIALMETINKIQARNSQVSGEKVLKNVTQVVEEVRQERYVQGK